MVEPNVNIKTIGKSLREKDLSVADLVAEAKERIAASDSKINAFLEVFDTKDDVLRAQKMLDDGTATPLTGIPIAVKDNILIKGRTVSAASKILENYHATYNATVIEKLTAAGAVLIGRTNMDEFAMGGSTENSAFGPTKNPIDTNRVPGGSSGGSAAAVASGFVPVSLGSDTGGSVRQPASFCGVVGLKPTYGAVSRHGLIAMGSSFDVIGTLAKNVSDVEVVFNTIKGCDRFDATSHDNTAVDVAPEKVIGVPDFVRKAKGLDPAVVENFSKATKRLTELGYKVVDVSLPHLEYALATYYVLIPAEISANMARFDGVKYGLSVTGKDVIDGYFKTRAAGLGAEVKRRIILGTYVLSTGYYDAYYGKASTTRSLIREDFKKAFEQVSVIVTPTAPSPAFKIGEKVADPLSMYLADLFTVPANLAGIPAISVPSGTTAVDGVDLPLGLQMMAAHGGEELLFSTAKKFLGEE